MQIRNRASLLAILAALLPIAGPFQAAPSPRATASAAAQSEARTPGLYMTFQTDKGDIACKLFEAEAPVTVHTMVGLAIGKLAYIDPQTKQAMRKKFFDGLDVSPGDSRLHDSGRRPSRQRHGTSRGPGFPVQEREVVEDAQVRRAGAAGHGQRRAQHERQPVLHYRGAAIFLQRRLYDLGSVRQHGCRKGHRAWSSATAATNLSRPYLSRMWLSSGVGPAPADAPEAMPPANPSN